VHLTHLFNHCFQLSHFPAPWKEAKNTSLPKPGNDPKFPQNVCPVSLLSTTGKLFGKLILRTIQTHIEERNLLNASKFGLQADHSTALQCMRLADDITLNCNNYMSTAAVFLDIEKAFHKTWQGKEFSSIDRQLKIKYLLTSLCVSCICNYSIQCVIP
jgi:hypothetical protein